MMGFFYLNNFIFECDLFNLLVCKRWISENSKNSKKQVVELGEEMGMSNYIEQVEVENYISESEASWVYFVKEAYFYSWKIWKTMMNTS